MALHIKGDSSIPGQNVTSVLTLLSLSQTYEMQVEIQDTLSYIYPTCSHLQAELEGRGDTTLRMRL